MAYETREHPRRDSLPYSLTPSANVSFCVSLSLAPAMRAPGTVAAPAELPEWTGDGQTQTALDKALDSSPSTDSGNRCQSLALAQPVTATVKVARLRGPLPEHPALSPRCTGRLVSGHVDLHDPPPSPLLLACPLRAFSRSPGGRARPTTINTLAQRKTRVHPQVHISKCAYLGRDRQPSGPKDRLLERHSGRSPSQGHLINPSL
jgi:hypothetical protein